MDLIIIITLILITGLFSMAEVALISVKKSRLESEAAKGNKSARAALALASDPDKFLPTIQIGITLISIINGLYSGKAYSENFAAFLMNSGISESFANIISNIVIVFGVTFFTIVLGELTPKKIGLDFSEKISKFMAKPMSMFAALMFPMVWVLSKTTQLIIRIFGFKPTSDDKKVTEEDIKAMVQEGVNTGEVQEVEHDIVSRVFHIGDRDIDSIMTYRTDFIWLNINDSKKIVQDKVLNNMHDFYPVSDGNGDSVLGIILLRDLFSEIDEDNFSLEKIIKQANYLPENKSIYSVLKLFKDTNVKYGLVTGEFGDVKGIVTMTNILEALVGEVTEEGKENNIITRDDGSILVDGQCPFYDFLEYFDMESQLSHLDYNTISGLILEILEHIPKTGEKFSWNNFDFEIIDMDGARIDKVLVSNTFKSNQ